MDRDTFIVSLKLVNQVLKMYPHSIPQAYTSVIYLRYEVYFRERIGRELSNTGLLCSVERHSSLNGCGLYILNLLCRVSGIV